MPRPTGLTRPQIGSGRASPGTVDVSAWSNPDQGTDGLRAHVQDPSRAHMASSTGIVDAGGYYLSDEVEGALQEIGGASAGGRQNGVVTGFGYTAVGLTVTFDTPSTALLPTLRDYSGESVTLPDNTVSVWVYISPATGLITQFLGANPPSISAPENVLLWQFTTLAGAITAARDARLYVRNLDRKLPYTVRSVGSQANQESEACFVTLDAALTYLQYSAVLGSNRSEVVVRGPVTTGPVDIPVSGVHFRGEDGASITLTSGGYLFDVQGRDGITFSDLALKTNVPGAITVIDTVGTSDLLSFARCAISSGTSAWQAGIILLSTTGRLTASNCSVTVTNDGIYSASPNGVLIDQVEAFAVNFVPGSIGIRVGASPTNPAERQSTVRSCQVTGFDTGIRVSGVGHVVTANNVVPGFGGAEGIRIDTDSRDVVVSANRVDCSVNGGLLGIRVSGSVTNKTVGVKITGNTVYGATVTGIILSGFVQETVVSDNQVDCNVPAAPSDPTAQAGILLATGVGPADIPTYVTVSGNVVWRAKTGIYLQGLSSRIIQEVVVTGNAVHHCAVGTIAPPVVFSDTSTGIGAEWCVGLNITGNNVYGIGRILTDAGTVVDPTPALVSSVGILVGDSDAVTVSGNQVRELYRKGASKSTGIWVNGTGSTLAPALSGLRVSDNGVAAVPNTGILLYMGSSTAVFTRTCDGAVVAGNTVNGVGAGIEVVADGRGLVSDLRVEGNNVNTTTNGAGISLFTVNAVLPVTPGVIIGAQVVGNTMSNLGGAGGYGVGVKCDDGASITRVNIDRNLIRSPNSDGIELTAGSPAGSGAANFNTISASGNEIAMTGAVGPRAIRWFSFVAAAVTDIEVSDNVITNTSTGFDYAMAGPGGAATSVQDFTVKRNSVVASNRGIYGVITGAFVRFTVAENNLEAALNVFTLAAQQPGGPTGIACTGLNLSRNRFRSVPDGINTNLSFQNMKVLDLKVEDNAFLGGSIASGGGLRLDVNGSSFGGAASVRNLVVRRNSFRDMQCIGTAINVPGPTDDVVDVALSDNTYESVGTAAILTRAPAIQCTFNAVVRNLAVRNNQFSSFSHSTSTHGGVDLTLSACQGVDVSGNQFDAGVTSSYGVVVGLETTANPGVLRDVTVHHNKSRGVSVAAAGFLNPALIRLDLDAFTEVSNVSVCDNDLNRIPNGTVGESGVLILSDQYVYRVACDRNRVSGANAATPITATAIAVSVNGGFGLSVSGNDVAGNPSIGAQGNGIAVSSTDNAIAVRVCDNTVVAEDGTSATGILVDASNTSNLNGSFVDHNHVRGYTANITVEFGSCNNLSVSRNNSFTHGIWGLNVSCLSAGTTAANLVVDGNEVSTSVDAQQYFVRVDIPNPGTGNFENLSVSDNTARYNQTTGADIASAYGIYVRSGSSGTTKLENAHICRNRVLSVTNGITVSTGDTLNVAIDGNDIRDVLAGITHAFAGDVIGYSVSKNAVQARTSSTATGLIYVRHSVTDKAFHEVAIDGNVVGGGISVAGSTHGGDGCIRVGEIVNGLANARSVSISGNQLRLSKYGIVTLFGSAQSLSIDNNKVTRIYNDGINLTSSWGGVAGDTDDLSISGNSVSLWCESASGDDRAIGLVIGTKGTDYARGINVANNNCFANNDTAKGFYIYFNANTRGFTFAHNIVNFPLFAPVPLGTKALDLYTTGVAVPTLTNHKNFVFTGNVFRGSANGVTYTNVGGVAPPPDACTFMGNIGDKTAAGFPNTGTWYQFQNGGGAGWTGVLPPPGAGAGQFENFNIDNGS